MHTKGRGGRLKKTISVTTNVVGADQNIKLVVEGDVWQPIDVSPTTAAFGRITAEAAAADKLVRKLTLVNNMEEPATIGDMRSTNPMFHVDAQVLEPGKKWELTVSLAGDVKTGNNSGQIEATTGLKEMPTLSIPVRVYITSDIDVMPPKLTLRPQRPAAMQRQFYVRNNTTNALQISDVATNDERLKATIIETKEGMTWKITVDIPSEYEVPKEGGQITFKTTHPRAPMVTIPVEVLNYPGQNAGRLDRNTARQMPARAETMKPAGKAVVPAGQVAPNSLQPTAPKADTPPATPAAAPTAPTTEE